MENVLRHLAVDKKKQEKHTKHEKNVFFRKHVTFSENRLRKTIYYGILVTIA